MKVQHGKSKRSKFSLLESDNEDLGDDPDIELGEEKECTDDLNMGRVIRKPTLPLPVSAPKKLKVSETVSAKPDNELATKTLNRETLPKQQDAVNTNKVLETSSSITNKAKEAQKDKIIGEQMTVEFDIKKRETSVQ